MVITTSGPGEGSLGLLFSFGLFALTEVFDLAVAECTFALGFGRA